MESGGRSAVAGKLARRDAAIGSRSQRIPPAPPDPSPSPQRGTLFECPRPPALAWAGRQSATYGFTAAGRHSRAGSSRPSAARQTAPMLSLAHVTNPGGAMTPYKLAP